MDGQWIGRLTGDVPGLAMLDLDREADHFRGSAFLFPDDLNLPGTYAEVVTADLRDSQDVVARIQAVDRNGRVLRAEEISQLYPNTAHAQTAELTFGVTQGKLVLGYRTNISSGSGFLEPSRSNDPSEVEPVEDVANWAAFKAWATSRPIQGAIFRGQPCLKRLRTSFHRTRRTDLVRFLQEDIEVLHRHLIPLTRHLFRLGDPQEMGAFFNLIQHHGYPTPLLDWTYSPFIAAFFAFREKPVDPINGKVRIFLFDKAAWSRVTPPLIVLTNRTPHFSVIDLLGIENHRMIPQQALSAVTNVDDIETFLRWREHVTAQRYLYAVDLPSSERNQVLDELELMGITAASLFPGLDGSCEALKGRMFGR